MPVRRSHFQSRTEVAQPLDEDAKFMRLALQEALRGLGRTSPNPAVGALIVSPKNRRVLSRGWHHAAGQPHAEIEALRGLRNPGSAHGTTLYVTLEPCSTHGRTPPCTEALLRAGFARVVVGTVDPNPAHAGRGLTLLRNAGVEVCVGVLEAECRELNRAFNNWITTGRPWVIAKVALGLDGHINRPPSEDRWLTSAAARAHAHSVRATVDAILVGAGTVRADNPRLTVRDVPGADPSRQPWRVVLTRSGKLPADAHLFTDKWKERTLVFQNSRRALDGVLRELGQKRVTSVLIEGGGVVLGQAFRERLVDEVHFYLAPLLAAGGQTALGQMSLPAGATIANPHFTQIGANIFCAGCVRYEDAQRQRDTSR